MAALTQDRKTPIRAGDHYSDPVAASTTIFSGALVVLDSSGNAAPGSTATGLTARGVAVEHVDNSDGSASDLSVATRTGIQRFDNSSGDAIARTDIGNDCYIVDDHTVSKTDGSSTQSKAGRVVDIDDDGVWVDIA